MNLNLKILKAINEGIRKSLLSFDDIEFEQSTDTNKKISNTITDWQWIQDNFVDLGLPSGTLWCKYNLGATNGNTPESWYGHYYMWGSTKPNDKDNCYWEIAPFNNDKHTFDKDYFVEHMYEFVYHNYNLLPEYDVAYQINNLMHMPSTQQIQELDKEAEHHWVENYNRVNGLNGWLFTGKNNNTLFIPAAGYRNLSSLYYVGSYCCLWSSSLSVYSPKYAYIFYFSSSSFSSSRCRYRYLGLSVRGVI